LLDVMEKSAAFVPEIAGALVNVTAVFPLLVTVKVNGLLLPVFTVPNVRGLGENVRAVVGV